MSHGPVAFWFVQSLVLPAKICNQWQTAAKHAYTIAAGVHALSEASIHLQHSAQLACTNLRHQSFLPMFSPSTSMQDFLALVLFTVSHSHSGMHLFQAKRTHAQVSVSLLLNRRSGTQQDRSGFSRWVLLSTVVQTAVCWSLTSTMPNRLTIWTTGVTSS